MIKLCVSFPCILIDFLFLSKEKPEFAAASWFCAFNENESTGISVSNNIRVLLSMNILIVRKHVTFQKYMLQESEKKKFRWMKFFYVTSAFVFLITLCLSF